MYGCPHTMGSRPARVPEWPIKVDDCDDLTGAATRASRGEARDDDGDANTIDEISDNVIRCRLVIRICDDTHLGANFERASAFLAACLARPARRSARAAAGAGPLSRRRAMIGSATTRASRGLRSTRHRSAQSSSRPSTASRNLHGDCAPRALRPQHRTATARAATTTIARRHEYTPAVVSSALQIFSRRGARARCDRARRASSGSLVRRAAGLWTRSRARPPRATKKTDAPAAIDQRGRRRP